MSEPARQLPDDTFSVPRKVEQRLDMLAAQERRLRIAAAGLDLVFPLFAIVLIVLSEILHAMKASTGPGFWVSVVATALITSVGAIRLRHRAEQLTDERWELKARAMLSALPPDQLDLNPQEAAHVTFFNRTEEPPPVEEQHPAPPATVPPDRVVELAMKTIRAAATTTAHVATPLPRISTPPSTP